MATLHEPDEIQNDADGIQAAYDLMRGDLEAEGSEVPSIEDFKEMIKEYDDY